MIPRLASIVLCLGAAAFTACAEVPTAPVDSPAYAKGGKPGGGGSGGGDGVVPIKLGNLKEIGCSGGEAYAISANTTPLVVGMAQGCRSGMKPLIWSAATGLAPTGSSPGDLARAVSDNGVIVGPTQDGQIVPAEFSMTGQVRRLPLPNGHAWADPTGITPDGSMVVGFGGDGVGSHEVIRWTRSGAASWSIEIIGPGVAYGVSGDGRLIAGAGAGRPAVWMRDGTGWSGQTLTSEDGSALAVNRPGTVVVGYRSPARAGTPDGRADVHTAWSLEPGGHWRVETLKGIDPAFDEGQALGVSSQLDGSTLIVGLSWEVSSGPGGTLRAVAWRRAADAPGFGTPIRLAPLSPAYGAIAYGVNSRGEVVGMAGTGKGFVPVMWRLQAP